MARRKDRTDEILRRYFRSLRGPGTEEAVEERIVSCHDELFLSEEAFPAGPGYSMNHIDRRTSPCPSSRVLGAYIDGTLPPGEAADVREHLSGCDRCRRIMKTVSDVVLRTRKGTSESVPEKLSSETSSRLSDLHRKSRSRKKSSDDL